MKQRVGIAMALLGDPTLLVLDEPLNGLDADGMRIMRKVFTDIVKDGKRSIVVSSHLLGELQKVATHYGIIRHGKMIREMTAEELDKVEGLVNAHIFLGEEIETKEMSLEDARKTGAMALFGEKYGATVRVVKMGNFSTELCGGTHLDNTAKAGLFKIISESSVAAGVRRIEATTGLGVLRLLGERDALITETAKELRANNPADIAKRAAAVSAELKSSAREIEMLNAKIASSKTDSIKNSAKPVGSCTLMVGKLEGVALDSARQITDDFKANDPSSVTVLAVVNDGKLNFVCSCGKNAVAAGAHAGNILKKLSVICGGGGGGRPDSATSGGKDTSKIDAALAAAEETLLSMLK